jgi:hypothetical protein
MNYSRIVLLRQPAHRVWDALQNEMPAVGTHIHGIESITRLARSHRKDGTVLTVHEWKAAGSLPSPILEHADGRALTWIERTVWDSATLSARWTVESQLLGQAVTGSGVTQLSGAMGNSGTRMRFEISANVNAGSLGPLGGARFANGISDAAVAVLAKTLQDLGSAIESFLLASEIRVPAAPRAPASRTRRGAAPRSSNVPPGKPGRRGDRSGPDEARPIRRR